MAFVRSNIELSQQDENGCTARDHYLALAKQTGIIPDELQITCHDSMRYLYDWFSDLHSNRYPKKKLSFGEIKAWADLLQTDIKPAEVRVLKLIDNLF